MKTISIFLALVNALLAGLLIASCISPTELIQGQIGWLVIKIIASAGVIVAGIITWLGSMHPLRAGLIPLCSLFLVALGAATTVWTLHLALISGNMEFHMVVYGGSLAVQGMASLFGFAEDSKSMVV